MPNKLTPDFYLEPNPVRAARGLLGKFLVVRSPEGITGGLIYETEAYGGPEDKACHGYNNRRTARTEIMFQEGGCAYVYLCYGIHYLFNIITGAAETPQGVLIRAVAVTDGREIVKARRPRVTEAHWASGPGKVCMALGIDRVHNGVDCRGEVLWVEDRGVIAPSRQIEATPRIGIGYAGEWARKPWRFVWSRGIEVSREFIQSR